jgi:hypothetical protein
VTLVSQPNKELGTGDPGQPNKDLGTGDTSQSAEQGIRNW